MKFISSSLLIILLIITISCSVGQVGYGAPPGLLYQDITLNHEFPRKSDLGSRLGSSCVESYAGLWSHGDAGIRAAAAEGGITTIHAVDYRIRNIFFIYMSTCTIVYGD